MPRMSKKRNHELSFYLNDRGRVTYNELYRKCQHGCRQSFRAVVVDCPPLFIQTSKEKGGTHRMNFEFMTIDTPLPPCMPFPRALTGFPVSSTAKVMYCRMLDAMLSKGQEDENGILFVCFPVTAIAAVLSRSSMTVKRSLNELETAGLIMRVRQGVGEPNRIYVLIPGKEDAALA